MPGGASPTLGGLSGAALEPDDDAVVEPDGADADADADADAVVGGGLVDAAR
jgi:hypothetical protein